MSDTVILFEDEGFQLFLPLVYSRPVFELRCGIFTLRERLSAMLVRQPAAICRPHLAAVYGAGRWPLRLLAEQNPLLFVNGRATDLPWLAALMAEPLNTIYISAGPQGQPVLVGARLSPTLASAVLELLGNPDLRNEMRTGLRKVARSLGPPGTATRAAHAILELAATASATGIPTPPTPPMP